MVNVNWRLTMRVVGTSAVLVTALLVFRSIVVAPIEPVWARLACASVPGALVLVGGIYWLFSGGEQGTHIDWSDGESRLVITNANLFARTLAHAALTAFSRRPLPLGSGKVKGNPADPASIIEDEVAGPADASAAKGDVEPADRAGVA